MNISGVLIKYNYHNEKTGDADVLLKDTDGKIIRCSGVCIRYPILTPLFLIGDYFDGTFIAVSVQAKETCREDTKKFLIKNIRGVGPEFVDEFLKRYSGDIFLTSRNRKDFSNQETMRKIERIIKHITDSEDTVQFVTKYGGSYHSAINLVSRQEYDGIDSIKKNPYTLVYTGVPFEVCDKIGKENGFSLYNKDRVDALVWTSVESSRKRGNTYTYFKDICNMADRFENGRKTDPFIIANALLNENRYHLGMKDGMVVAWALRDYKNEAAVAENLQRLTMSATGLSFSEIGVDQIEKEIGIAFSEDQKTIFRCLQKTGVKIITGGPGTGKTTVLNGLLKEYRRLNPGKEIALCAPTGCAAKRMTESTGLKAQTIHKLLNIRPFERNSDEKAISADCIIVDECSMIDTELFLKLLANIKNGALLILIGDEDQLPSIGPGNILADLIASEKFETFRLNQIHRQSGNSVIVDNSKKIIRGEKALLQEEGKFVVFRTDLQKMTEKAANIIRFCEKDGKSAKVFTPVKKPSFVASTSRLNKLVQGRVSRKSSESVHYGFNQYYLGDRVIFLANKYDKGYINGQEGIITCIQQHSGTSFVTILTEGEHITLRGDELEDIDLSYSITAHKAQGSECDYAVILIPKKPYSMLKRKLLYVEVTRAKKGVCIISEGNALELCISDFTEVKRNTGLKDMLKNRELCN